MLNIKELPSHDSEIRGYIGWGPYEDYMTTKDADEHSLEFSSWAAFKAYGLGHGRVIDFYFTSRHDGYQCKACDGHGYNQETLHISETFYDFGGTGERWCDRITQDEVEALLAKGRLTDFTRGKSEGYVPTAEEVNAAQNRRGSGFTFHDAINRWILIETRAKRLGVWRHCETCQSEGEIRTSDDFICLRLWLLNQAKGTGRGVHIEHITDADMPDIRNFLTEQYGQIASEFAFCTDAFVPVPCVSPGWHPREGRMARSGGWSQTLTHETWADFVDGFHDCDDDLNLVASFYRNQNGLCLWMLHPRKGASRGIIVSQVTDADMPSVRGFLARSLNKHTEHFRWALSSEMANAHRGD